MGYPHTIQYQSGMA